MKSFLGALNTHWFLLFILALAFTMLTFLPTDRAEAITERVSSLLELAEQKFDTLSEVEEKLFRAVAEGKTADYSAKDKEQNAPALAEKWGDNRVIKASRIAWLCHDPQVSLLVTNRGIRIRGARIDGRLDLRLIRIPFALEFNNCSLKEGIDLQSAEIREMDFSGTYTGPIKADGLKVDRNLSFVDGFKADGEVRLLGATIGGNLQSRYASFKNVGGKAFSADQVEVNGSVYLAEGFKAEGEVRLLSARIRGDLNCNGGQFINEGKKALNAQRVRVGGTVFLRNDSGAEEDIFQDDGFQARGEVDLKGARIGGNLECDNGRFLNAKGIAINAELVNVEGNVFLREGLRAEGEVILSGARIGGNLECDNGKFLNERKDALVLHDMKVGGNVLMRNGFHAKGQVGMIGGVIGGNFECGNGQFSNDNAIALNASGIEVNGIVYLGDGFKAEGKVCLTNAIVGRLNCCGGHFLNEDSNALTADSLKVDGDVNFCNRSMVDGKVSLINAKINGSFIWSGIGSPTKVTLDLRFAKLRSLVDNPSSWPGEGRLFLHGLIYDEIDGIEPVSVQARLKWLRRQPSGHFWPQPYEQLSMVLRKQGRDEDAKHILIEKNRDRARRMRLSVSEWWWYYVFGPMICYGYCPWKALWFVFLIIGLGWIVFWIGFRSGVMTPTKKDAYSIEKARKDKPLSDEYPKFNSFIYSVDTFIPLVDLQIAKYWLPNANLKGGRFLRLYLWIHILFGWLLTTLIVVGLTGLVRS